MKKTHAFLTALLVMAVLFASCSHGGGSSDSDGAAKTQAVEVTLTLGGEAENVIQKAMALDINDDSLTYWIKAEPQWTNNTETIHNGKTTSFTEIQNYAAEVSLGKFTPGVWKFSAQIKNGANIAYEGDTTVVISPANNDVTINMQIYGHGSTGSITIKVAVPTVETTKVFVSYDGATAVEITNPTPIAHTIVDQAGVTTTYNAQSGEGLAGKNWTYFTTSKADLSTGNHTVALIYKDGDSVIGGYGPKAFTVRNGDAFRLYGTIQNGPWEEGSLTLVMPVVELAVSEITYTTGTASITTIAGATYAWYVNGQAATAATNSNSYAFGTNYKTPGEYDIRVVVTKGDAIGDAEYHVTIPEN